MTPLSALKREVARLLAELERFKIQCACGNRFLPQDMNDRYCSDDCEVQARRWEEAERYGDEILHGDR